MSEKSLIQKAAADFAVATLAPVSFVPEKTAEYTEDAVKEMAAKGFLKVADLEEAAIVAEEFGKQNASMAEVAVVANVTAQTLKANGIAADGITGFAVLEEGRSCGGVTAAKAGDAYTITGKKIAVAMGGAADQYIVIAALDEAPAAFLVKAADVKNTEKFDKLGLRSYPTADLTFEAAPATLITADGAALRAEVSAKIDVLNCFVAAGLADTCTSVAAEYSKTRVQFGAPIAKLPAVQFLLAEISINQFALKAVGTAALASNDIVIAGAKAKYVGAKAAWDAASNCVQIHGGTGYSREYPIERYYREARTLFSNSEYVDVPQNIVAKELLK
jgi:alkylation response protein AidB-like acyl-CoA dehydrogenase